MSWATFATQVPCAPPAGSAAAVPVSSDFSGLPVFAGLLVFSGFPVFSGLALSVASGVLSSLGALVPGHHGHQPGGTRCPDGGRDPEPGDQRHRDQGAQPGPSGGAVEQLPQHVASQRDRHQAHRPPGRWCYRPTSAIAPWWDTMAGHDPTPDKQTTSS